MNFKEWFKEQVLLESAGRPGVKQGLYPPGYGGIGLYAPCDWTPYGADAITYMPKSWLNFKFLHTFKAPVKANWDDFQYVSIPYYMPEAYSYWDGHQKVQTNIIILWKDQYGGKPKMQGKAGGMAWQNFMQNANAGHGTAYYIEAPSKDAALGLVDMAEPHPTLKNVYYYGPGAKAATGA